MTHEERWASMEKYGVAFEVVSGYDIVHDRTEVRIQVHLPSGQVYVPHYRPDGESTALTEREIALGLRGIAKRIAQNALERTAK